jgi:hypothetical protein
MSPASQAEAGVLNTDPGHYWTHSKFIILLCYNHKYPHSTLVIVTKIPPFLKWELADGKKKDLYSAESRDSSFSWWMPLLCGRIFIQILFRNRIEFIIHSKPIQSRVQGLIVIMFFFLSEINDGYNSVIGAC